MVKNRIHSIVDRQSEEVRSSKPKVSNLFGKLGRSWLDNLELPEAESGRLKEMLAMLDFLGEQIRKSNKQVDDLFRSGDPGKNFETILKYDGSPARFVKGKTSRFATLDKPAVPPLTIVGFKAFPQKVSASGKTTENRLPTIGLGRKIPDCHLIRRTADE